ncbi:hypothetical protein NPIL_517711 [Nephila pilipes]|uniref:Uncharacterized protein n=1 Tax=Nephila pilipes TaxID=299642 RepID=A0A8X6QLX5_NEPPI|nr:hypothetical protein NPIL_517711 [Nephila pilipes]
MPIKSMQIYTPPVACAEDEVLHSADYVGFSWFSRVTRMGVSSCGRVYPRPPPSMLDEAFSFLTRIERHRQKDPPWYSRAEESDDSRILLLGAVPDPTG